MRHGARTGGGRGLQATAVRGKTRRRMYGLFTGHAIEERREIQALLGEARKLLEEMK